MFIKWINDKLLFKKYSDRFNDSKALYAFLETTVFQSLEDRKVKIIYIYHNINIKCSVEISIEKEKFKKIGMEVPVGFKIEEYWPKPDDNLYEENLRYAKKFNKNNIRFVTDELMKPNIPFEIEIIINNIEKISEQLDVSFTFSLNGDGGGSIPGNVIIGLSDEAALSEQDRIWKRRKLNWEKYKET